MDLVSVIVPFHKGLHYLKDCLDGLLDQTYKALEVIVIRQNDDGLAEAMVKEYEKRGLAIYDVEANHSQGVAAARNLGLAMSKGEYVYFLDSDDYLLNDTIHKLVSAAGKNNSEVVIGKWELSWFKRDGFLMEYEKRAAPNDDDASPPSVPDVLRTGLSVLNILIKKDFILSHSLTMNENFIYYSDEIFLTELLSKQPSLSMEPNALYVKRYHNDPVTLPSLNQINDENKAFEYLEGYLICINHSRDIPWLTDVLEFLFCQYTLGLFFTSTSIRFPNLLDKTKKGYIDAFQDIDPAKFHDVSRIEKRILKRLKKGKVRSASRLAKILHFHKKKKGLFGNRVQWYRVIDRLVFRRMPVREDWILFESFFGRNYDDSGKYIYEYLLEHDARRFRFIWVLHDKKKMRKGRPTIIKRDSLRYFYYTSRCKYWINNMRQPLWWKKRPGMVFLQTWHGTPLKRLVFDMDDVHSASPMYKKNFYDQSRLWDYLLSDNRFSTEVFERAFLFNKDNILEYGYPRNDVLYKKNKDAIATGVRECLNIPPNVKTILYAPTWRDDDYYGPGRYKFSLALDLDYLHEKLGDGYMVLLRTHYFIADRLDLEGKGDFVRNVSGYDDIGELYLVSDICITDYSSVFFDYANLRRPILFYVYDFKKYKDVLRGFYIDMERELPGPLLYTNEDVVWAIQNVNDVINDYGKRYEAFYQKYCHLDDGLASERVVKKIFC